MRVIKAAKAKRTNASGDAKLAPALVLGGALAVLDPVELVVVAVLEEVPVFLLDFATNMACVESMLTTGGGASSSGG